MATTYIPVNTTKRLGAQLRQAHAQIQQAKDTLESLKPIMETQVDGTDFSLVATEFGVAGSDGEITYNLVSGVVAALAVSEVDQFLRRLG